MKNENGLTRRQQQAIDTRKKILNTSIRLIKENGYDQVTVDDICAACNLSKGAFYHHFHSKLDIISASETQLNDVLATVYKDNKDEPFRERLLLFINSMLAEVDRSGIEITRQRTIYTVSGEYAREENSKTFSVESRNIMQKIIRQAIDRGELKPNTPAEQITEILMTFVCGMIADWCIFDGTYSLVDKSWSLTISLVDGLIRQYETI